MRRIALAALAAGCVQPSPPPECPAGFDVVDGRCVEAALPALVVIDGDHDGVGLCEVGNAVRGDLVIASASTVETLGCLQQVGGDLRVEDLDGLERLALPSLVHVGGDLSIQGNFDLTAIELARLESVARGFALQFNPSLTDASFPALGQVDGYTSIYRHESLRRWSAPRLTSVGDLLGGVFYIRLNVALEALDVPALQSVGSVLKVTGNDALTALPLPALRTVGDGLYLSFNSSLAEVEIPLEASGGLLYVDRTSLRRVSFPALTAVERDVAVLSNPQLTSLLAPALRHVGAAVEIRQNGQWPDDAIDAFIEGIGEDNIGGGVHRGDNGG